jgi:hypothetical protein
MGIMGAMEAGMAGTDAPAPAAEVGTTVAPAATGALRAGEGDPDICDQVVGAPTAAPAVLPIRKSRPESVWATLPPARAAGLVKE